MPCGCRAGAWRVPATARGGERTGDGERRDDLGNWAYCSHTTERWKSLGTATRMSLPSATPGHRQRRHKATAVLPQKGNNCPRQWLFLSTLRMNGWTDNPARACMELQEERGPGEPLAAQAVHGCGPTHTHSEPLPLGLLQHAAPTPTRVLSPSVPPRRSSGFKSSCS